MKRRTFLQMAGAPLAARAAAGPRSRAESMEWFRKARFGLFMHYGVYSILGRG